MAKTNTVKNAKAAARKFLSAVVDGVRKGSKGKDTDDKPKGSKVSQKVTGVSPAPTVPKGKKDTTDTDDKPKGSKKKTKKKSADLSEPRVGLTKSERKGLHKAVDADATSKAKNTLGRGAARAKVFGHSASAVWRALGFAHTKPTGKGGDGLYTRSDCLSLRDGLGLNGVITDANCNLQFGDGRGRHNKGVAANDPDGGLYGGVVAELTSADWKVVNAIVKAAREE